MRRLLAAVALLMATALPSAAGELAIEAQVGYFGMNAESSAKAVFGSSGGLTFGGAVRYDVWRGVFVSGGVRTFSKDGERVFLTSPGAAIQKLGFPVSVRLTPILLSAGYRYVHWKWVVPYASVGAAITSYSETSDVAGQSFDQDFTRTGFVGAVGLETAPRPPARRRGARLLDGLECRRLRRHLEGLRRRRHRRLHVVGKVIFVFGSKPQKRHPWRPNFPKP